MKAKTLALLGGLFLLLLIAAFYPQISSRIRPVETDAPLADAPDLTRFNTENVNKVEFLTSAQTITLEKKDGSWSVDGKKADSKEVDTFFEALKNAKIKELAGENAANHTGFGVAEKGSATMTINGENSFILGNSGYQPNTFYMRGKDQDKVFLAGGELQSTASQNADFWRDKEILNIDATKIAGFNVESDSLKYSVTKAAPTSPSPSAEASAASPSPEASAVATPEATGLTTPEASASPDNAPAYILTSGKKKLDVPSEIAKVIGNALSPLNASGFLSAEEAKVFDEKKEGKWTITALDANGNPLGKITVTEDKSLLQGKADGFEDAFKMPAFELDAFVTSLPDLINPKAKE